MGVTCSTRNNGINSETQKPDMRFKLQRWQRSLCVQVRPGTFQLGTDVGRFAKSSVCGICDLGVVEDCFFF